MVFGNEPNPPLDPRLPQARDVSPYNRNCVRGNQPTLIGIVQKATAVQRARRSDGPIIARIPHGTERTASCGHRFRRQGCGETVRAKRDDPENSDAATCRRPRPMERLLVCTAAEDDVTRRGGKNHQCCEPTTHGCGSDRCDFTGQYPHTHDTPLAASPCLIVLPLEMPGATLLFERLHDELLKCAAIRPTLAIRPTDLGRPPETESLCSIRQTASV